MNKMKKIGFVTPWYGENIPGGAEMELRGLAAHLYQSGMDLEILTTCVKQFSSDWNQNYYPPGIDNVGGVPVRRFPIRKRDTVKFDAVNYKYMNSLPVSLKEEDTFLSEMIHSPKLYNYIAKKQNEYALFVFIPYMFGTTYRGVQVCPAKSVLIPCLHDESYAYITRFKEAFSSVHGMVLLARPEFALANRIYDLSNIVAEILGAGVDIDIHGNATSFRNKYGIKAPFILYAGRKEKGKNVHTLLQYFDTYKRKDPGDLRLVLIGGGNIELPEKSIGFIDDLGFIDVQDKYDAYAAALLLCQPSHNESFSLVIMESWLCGRPTLVSAHCEVTKDFVQESNGGLYFSNYPEFERCVSYLRDHPAQAGQIGHQGREFVLANFSWDVIVRKYTDYFYRMCGGVE